MASTTSSRLMKSGSAPPGAPTSLSVASSTTQTKSIILSWSAPVGPVTGYKIYRGATLLSTQNSTSYTESNLAEYSTTYTYSVYAYNLIGLSLSAATGSATTNQPCANTTHTLIGDSAGTYTASQQTQNVPAGCFKVRIRALSGGGGGFAHNQTHQGSCYGPYGAGGGGAYIDGTASVSAGTSMTFRAAASVLNEVSGDWSGVDGICAVTGGVKGQNITSNSGGVVMANIVGASVTNGDASSDMRGGAAALSGQNPTGQTGLIHGTYRDQPCGRCNGCVGSKGFVYGGGGAAGTDSSSLWGEASFRGGDGAQGYCVWTWAEQ